MVITHSSILPTLHPSRGHAGAHRLDASYAPGLCQPPSEGIIASTSFGPTAALVGARPVVSLKDWIDNRPGGLNRVFADEECSRNNSETRPGFAPISFERFYVHIVRAFRVRLGSTGQTRDPNSAFTSLSLAACRSLAIPADASPWSWDMPS